MATAKKQTPKQRAEMDAVLVRMLNTPPTPHVPPPTESPKGRSVKARKKG